MKKSLILLGALPVALLTATLLFENPNFDTGVYESRSSSSLVEANTAEGMLDYYHKLRGDYTREDYLRVKAEVDAMPVNRETVSWMEHGPDNVGGRTRAIIVDNNDINHVYAGSVSGGLFESINRGNFWTPVTEFQENLAVSSMCQTPDGTIYVATGHSAETSSGSQNAYDSGANGDGVYRMESDGSFTQLPTTGNFTWINEIRSDTISNRVWIASSSGLRQYDPIGDVVSSVSNGLSAGACQALDISKDGTIIVAGMSGGKTNVSQNGGASFFDMTKAVNSSSPISAGAGRMEYSISHERATNGNYYIYAVGGNSFLTGVWFSQDNGSTWTQTAPANNQQPGSFSPFATGGGSGQASYDMIISAVKGNPEKMMLGGIDTYSWGTTGNWTQLSQWFLSPTNPQYLHADQHEMYWDASGRLYVGNDGGVQISDDGGQTFYPANRGFNVSQFYAIGASAHGDLIGGLQDNGTFVNYHDNSTWHEFDEVGGGDGFSSEISFLNRDMIFSSIYYSFVSRSADRGGNSNTFIPTEFANAGSNALGCNPGSTDGTGCGQFFTNFRLWENPNDLNSADSISFIPSKGYDMGDTVEVPSTSAQIILDYVTPTNVVFDDTVVYNSGLTTSDTIVTSIAPSNDYNLTVFEYTITFGAHPLTAGDSVYLMALDTTIVVESFLLIDHYYGTNPLRPGKVIDMGNDSLIFAISWDTLTVQDPIQSWMAIGLGGGDGVWMTRNALRLSSPSEEWFRVNTSGIGTVSSMEFSRDGNHLFVGTWNGQLYRLSGFNNVYSPAKSDDIPNGIYADTLIDVNNVVIPSNLVTSWTQIGAFGAPVTGIGLYPSDPEHVTVTLGYFSGSSKVRECTNAATGSCATWTNVNGNLPNNLPVYGIVMVDPQNWVIGTDMGTYSTQNGGISWVNCSGGIGNTPVFDMRINWRTYNEGCFRPNEIYAGTHGRGIWSTDTYLALPGLQDNLKSDKFVPNIIIYPNPMVGQGTIKFDLESNAKVTVQIFNLSGQLVKEINEVSTSAGTNNITFGTSEMSKGTYIVRLRAGDKVETSKFIKH